VYFALTLIILPHLMISLQNFFLQLIRLADGGPKYAETDLSQFIVEPWNAASAALFVVMVAYWAVKLHYSRKRNSFLRYSMPILAIGGVGGTLYHAFRSSHYYLIMDYLPIMVLCLSAGLYFTYKVVGRKRYLSVATVGAILAQYVAFKYSPPTWATNVSYALLASYILVPVLFFMWKTQFRYYYYVGAALLSFAAALFCRIADFWQEPLLEFGTHWLWHTFGALACHLMFTYLFCVNQETEIPDEDDEEEMPHAADSPHTTQHAQQQGKQQGNL
jgi:hypothetical protein